MSRLIELAEKALESVFGKSNIVISREPDLNNKNNNHNLQELCFKKLFVEQLKNEGVKIPKKDSYHSCFLCDGKDYNCPGYGEPD